MQSWSVLYTTAPFRGLMADICASFTRVITNTLELLSSSRMDAGCRVCGLSPILTCPLKMLIISRDMIKRGRYCFTLVLFEGFAMQLTNLNLWGYFSDISRQNAQFKGERGRLWVYL